MATIFEKEELTSYHILTSLQKDKNLSQRTLSSHMGVNVASVNFALKRLITKGFIKMIGVNPRRIKYIVTPRGLKEKSELAYKFFDRNFHFYKDVRNDIEEKIQEVSNGKSTKVAICGKNQLSEITVLAIQNMELNLVGIFNGKDSKRGEKFLGHEVYALKNMKDRQPHIVLLTDDENIDLAKDIAKEVGCISIDLTGYYKV
ncbi:MAG: winged helix-turn-helix transcriptional regulator [Candidatus Anammoxibacter sp.]